MALKRTVPEDAEIVSEFFNELMKSKYGAILFKDFRSTKDTISSCVNMGESLRDMYECLLILNANSEPIGFVTYDKNKWLDIYLSKITYLYIKPEYRKQGYMSEVLKDFELWSEVTGCNFCALGIMRGKANPSRRGYKKFEVMYMKEIK